MEQWLASSRLVKRMEILDIFYEGKPAQVIILEQVRLIDPDEQIGQMI